MALLLLSERPEDIRFGQVLSYHNGIPCVTIQTIAKLSEALKKNSTSIILWDVDHLGALAVNHPFSNELVYKLLKAYSKPEYTFAISTKPLYQMPELSQFPGFNHQILRRFQQMPTKLISQILLATAHSVESSVSIASGLSLFFEAEVKIQKIILSKSPHRALAINAITHVLAILKLPSRLNVVIAQAIDELLMNAIFDAPVKDGHFYRKKQNRSDVFSLDPSEIVELSFAYNTHYVGICVRDLFGSIVKNNLLHYIRKDHVHYQYIPVANAVSAGLGIYGILQTGMSLLYMTTPYKQTDAYLFIPRAKNMQLIRKSFQFWSVI